MSKVGDAGTAASSQHEVELEGLKYCVVATMRALQRYDIRSALSLSFNPGPRV